MTTRPKERGEEKEEEEKGWASSEEEEEECARSWAWGEWVGGWVGWDGGDVWVALCG